MNSMTSILQCRNIHKSFSTLGTSQGPLDVLQGVDLAVAPGEMIAIVGASGSGKSTLLHILGGLDTPNEGEVFWGNDNIWKLRDEPLARLRAEKVGFVFQFHHLLPEFTALENVAIPRLILGANEKDAHERAAALLGRVGLAARSGHKPGELSGGEQQRVAVARALANSPQIVFADEPTGNLDSRNSDELLELFQQLNREGGQSFVIVTHSGKFARFASRRLRMADGRLWEESGSVSSAGNETL
jgi:lipoprotein-releasing system ATP-binding protein